MEVTKQLTTLGTPIGHYLYKGFKGYGLVSGKEFSLEDGYIVFVECKAPLITEVYDFFRTSKVFVGKPKLFDSDSLDFEVIGDLADDGLVNLNEQPLCASAIDTVLIFLIQHFLF